jgi:predicted helicase
MSALDCILQSYRTAAVTEREKGTYFERLALAYLRNDPKYPFELFQRVVTVSLETMQIVNSLPKLEID